MDILKKIFPLSFKVNEVKDLVISILIYIALGVAIAIVGAILAFIPLLGVILAAIVGIIGWVVDLYSLVGIVLAVLVFTKVLQ